MNIQFVIVGRNGQDLRLKCIKYGLGVTGYAHFSPLLLQYAFSINQEGAAHDAHICTAIQFLFVDHIELFAQQFFAVG